MLTDAEGKATLRVIASDAATTVRVDVPGAHRWAAWALAKRRSGWSRDVTHGSGRNSQASFNEKANLLHKLAFHQTLFLNPFVLKKNVLGNAATTAPVLSTALPVGFENSTARFAAGCSTAWSVQNWIADFRKDLK